MIGLTRDTKHFYEAQYPGIQQGKQPGITTIQGVMDKPALVPWAKRETAIAAIRNWDTLRSMVAQYPPNGDLAYHPAVSFLKATPGYQRDAAADIGTRVHAVAEALAKGEKPSVDEDTLAFAEAYVRDFLEPMKPKFHPLYTEAMVYHSGADGSVLPYGGTMDAFCENRRHRLAHRLQDGEVRCLSRDRAPACRGSIRRVHRPPRRRQALPHPEGREVRGPVGPSRGRAAHRVRRDPAGVPSVHRLPLPVALGP